MLQFLALAFLPGLDDLSPPSIGKSNRPAGRMFKVFALNLATINERECKPVRYRRTKFFRQIEGETWASGTVGVQEADCWVESDRFQRSYGFVSEKRIKKREQRIEIVERRAA